MTAHKHLKELVRARMRKTNESYTTARRHILREVEVLRDTSPGRWHLPGNIPATSALRILLTAAGVCDRRNGQPFSEAMLFGICGGVGMGLASFYYDKWNFSTFFIGGRHLWNDDRAYLEAALARFGIKPAIREASGKKDAAKQLREVLGEGRPCIAWVDMAELPHRGMPAMFSGGGYHVVTVYEIDDDRGIALIGDLTDLPIEISFDQFAVARGRIKQFKNRLLSIPKSEDAADLSARIRPGLQACHDGLKRGSGRGAAAMSGLEVLEKWKMQLATSRSKESWEGLFPRGHRLWQGLTSIYDFIENYHTGGGLCRPLFSEFLAEASELSGWERLGTLSKQYADLGEQWSELALAAIPQDVPEFRTVRELCVLRAELRSVGDPADVEKIRDVWARLSELRKDAAKNFPLSESQCADLQELLHDKVGALLDAEQAAHASLGDALKLGGGHVA